MFRDLDAKPWDPSQRRFGTKARIASSGTRPRVVTRSSIIAPEITPFLQPPAVAWIVVTLPDSTVIITSQSSRASPRGDILRGVEPHPIE